MSTATPTPYVPYQAYRSKRHSRVLSSGTTTPNAERPNQTRHGSSSSADLIPKINGVDNNPKASTTNLNGDVAPDDIAGLTRHSSPSSRPASIVIVPQQTNGKDVSSSSDQTSPTSPKSPSTVSSVTGIRINGAPLDSPSMTEPSSPMSSQSASAVSLNDIRAPTTETNAKAVAFPSLSLAFPSEKAAGKAPAGAGPSTPTSPLSSKSAVNPRRTSTFRYVSLRPSANANSTRGSSTAPRTSSPLRPAGAYSHNRASSTSGFSPLSSARQLGDQPSPIQAATRSPASIHSDLTPDTTQATLLQPMITNTHHRITSMQVSNIPPRINPPQRTSSLPPPPVPPAKPTSSPSVSASASPALGPTLAPAPSVSSTSSRVQSPVSQSAPSTSVSTPTSSTSTATAAHRTVYRPGFQPKGVYRPLTDDFLALRKRARDKGRIELTRLERRFEKLVDLHFSPKSDVGEGSSNGREKEKSGVRPRSGLRPRPVSAIYEAPTLARRASSFFEELGDLRGKSASELWRSVIESRAAAANGGKGDIRSAEQRITPWQDDAEVSACPHCSTSFHPLTNRKHHCRLCGRVVCSLPVKEPQRAVPCSLLFVSDPKTGRIEEVAEGVDYGVKPRARTTSTVGMKGDEEKFLKGVRICRECKPVMLRQQYRQDAKRVPIVIRLYEALISLESEIEDTLPQFQELMLSLSNNPDEAPTKEASAARKHLLQCFADYETIAKRIRKIPCPGGPGSSQDRVQAAILARATNFLQKNMFPLQSLPKPKRRATNADTNGDESTSGDKEVIDLDSELARALQPLLEQEALLESFVEEATTHRKFEDARTLKANLAEIRAEIDRIVANADIPTP